MHLTPGPCFAPGDMGILNDTVAYWTSGLAGCGVRRPGSAECFRPSSSARVREPSSPATNQTRESFTVANIKSQIKRIKTNEKARLRNKSVKSELKTYVRRVREAVEAGDKDAALEHLKAASRKLDKAVSKGVIHKNQAANRKSKLAKRVASL